MRRTFAIALAVACATCVCGAPARAELTPPRSNVRLVEDCVRRAAGAMVAKCPPVPGDSAIGVRAQGADGENWMVEHIVGEQLESRGFRASTRAQPSADTTGSTHRTLATPYVFEYRVAELALTYPRVYRSGLFGSKKVERSTRVSLFGRMINARSGDVLWVGEGASADLDAVRASDIALLSSPSVPGATAPTIPASRGLTRVVEPVLVTAIIAGLVTLFYSNR